MKKIILLIEFILLLTLNLYAQKSKNYYSFQTEDNNICDICFTQNNCVMGVADNKVIKLFLLESKELVRVFKNGHNKQILSIDISQDSSILVSGGKDSIVAIWDLKTGKLLKSLKCTGIITSVSISPDSHYLAYGGSENKVFIYDIKNNIIINTFSEHSDDITSVSFSPDGKLIASSSGDKLINIYGNGALITKLSGHTNWVRDILFNPDNTRLVSCGDDGKIITWNIKDLNAPSIFFEGKYGLNWLLSVDYIWDSNTFILGDLNGNIRIANPFAHYKARVKWAINKILFIPNEGNYIKLAAATRGAGVLLIEGKSMKSGGRY